MRANERLVASDGYEVLLFPLEYMNISQGEHTLAIDFLGWGANGRILQCPYYAPCSCTCIASSGADNRIWQSNNKVHLADGTLDYVCWVQAHDDTPLPVGTVKQQGELIGHTGTTGITTGDHLHLNVALGIYSGWDPATSNTRLKNSIHIYNAMYVNDTTIINGEGYNWRTWTQPTPTIRNRNIFKWVLYARKLRMKAQK